MRVFSFGGGVQSTACLVLAAHGKIDFKTFLFANVGDDSEDPRTLDYVRNIAMPYASVNGIRIHELRRKMKDGRARTLLEKMTETKNIGIPVYMSTGAPGKRSCTYDYKIQVIIKWLRSHNATKDNPAITGLGISLDEVHRARTDSGFDEQVLTYPLLDLKFRRSECIDLIRNAGLPIPPKSACYFCPFHSPSAWKRLSVERPDLMGKAILLEDMINKRRESQGKNKVFLTRFKKPLRDVIDSMENQGELDIDTGACESGFCFT